VGFPGWSSWWALWIAPIAGFTDCGIGLIHAFHLSTLEGPHLTGVCAVMSGWETQLQIVLEAFGATLLGGIIGIEREVSDKPAGLRTLMLVAAASAILMSVGQELQGRYQFGLDSSRVIQAIVTGIAFLGAGTIIRRGSEEHVEGLTTAATILVAATIGICMAADLYVLACGLTLLTLLVLTIFKRLLLYFQRKRNASGDGPDF